MTLFHGSDNREIDNFIDMRRRNDCDFGHGVYFSTVFNHALENSCKGKDTGAVYEIDVNLDGLVDLNIGDKSNDDLYYVLYLCRLELEDIAMENIPGFADADYIQGLVLDGNGSEEYKMCAELFNAGDIGEDELKRQTELARKKAKYQFCIKTQKALDVINHAPRKVYFTQRVNGKPQIVNNISRL